ncbi:MAG TPA: M24 family metallopeptidase, partial [Steroidobacteraceae bacterium]|nr:M24 family metallopeptidase [Steroidobacteraceae bacterium]
MNEMAQSLREAQRKAEALFAEVAGSGMIRGGKLESELSTEIHALAKSRFGLRRHWHKRLVRSGENTLLTYYDEALDRRMQDDDIVYLDFGPVFEAWEADFGRTYAIGADPLKHKLVDDIAAAF